MSNHTSGTWTVRPVLRPDLDDDPMGQYVVVQAQQQLTARYWEAEPETLELEAVHAENEANAHLIAAAPDLLKALEQLIEMEDEPPLTFRFLACRSYRWDAARTAVAKAMGW